MEGYRDIQTNRLPEYEQTMNHVNSQQMQETLVLRQKYLESKAKPGLVATEAVTTVTVDPATASFTVQHTYRLSNTASDETFAGFYEIFPPTAFDVTASVGGVSTTAVSVPVSAGFAEWFVPFPEALTPDSSPVDVVVRWRASGLTGDPNAFDRVSEGVVSIAPYAVGRGAEAELIVQC